MGQVWGKHNPGLVKVRTIYLHPYNQFNTAVTHTLHPTSPPHYNTEIHLIASFQHSNDTKRLFYLIKIFILQWETGFDGN